MFEESEVELVHAADQKQIHCIVYGDPSERAYWDVTMCGVTPPRGQVDWVVRTDDDDPLVVGNLCHECVRQLANTTAQVAKRA